MPVTDVKITEHGPITRGTALVNGKPCEWQGLDGWAGFFLERATVDGRKLPYGLAPWRLLSRGINEARHVPL